MKIENRWTPIKFLNVRNKEKIWLMRCLCGTEKPVMYKNYKRGKSLSCGCYNREVTTGRVSPLRKPYGKSCFNHLLLVYKRGAKERNLSWELSRNQFKTLTKDICHYCGNPPSQITGRGKYTTINGDYVYNGIDRKDNLLGYNKFNCVTCCKTCNYAKHNLNYYVFLQWIHKLVNYRRTL